MLKVEIDGQSGFCGGVIRAISGAESFLQEARTRQGEEARLYSLGDIVHNEAELQRLRSLGLVTVDKEDVSQMQDATGETILIRAHGEQPATYDKLRKLNFNIIDCTCPVVLRLQQSIREAHARMKPCGGQILIFGKIGHAEVLGLVGQVDGDAMVVESLGQLKDLLEVGLVRTDRPMEVFSQTTMSPNEYVQVCELLGEKMSESGLLHVHDTICRQVAFRHLQLEEFARAHDVIIFVSGRKSSNGKVLCDHCKNTNFRTFHVGGTSEIHKEWFGPNDSVGICGATSTPKWLLEEVASFIENLQ